MIADAINILFPKVCLACHGFLSDNESTICTDCRFDLPVTNFHHEADDTVLKVFYGRNRVEQATALLRFEKKGIVQQLIHNLKYRGHQEIGTFLGKWLGEELKDIPSYQSIDVVVPVPLHKKKLRKRGFNQVERFGKKIALCLNADYVDDVLIKTTNTNSQVFKDRFARWMKAKEVFSTQNLDKIQGKHVLLVDDLITTGATLEACMNQLNPKNEVKISIATMAIA